MLLPAHSHRPLFLAAAAWNILVGAAALAFRPFAVELFYGPAALTDDLLARLTWGDFWINVILLGLGYYIVSRDTSKNHGLVRLGILGKLGVAAIVTHRYLTGLARPALLLPAAVDLIFAILFITFLIDRRVPRVRLGEPVPPKFRP